MKQKHQKPDTASPSVPQRLRLDEIPPGLLACPRCQSALTVDGDRLNNARSPIWCHPCSWGVRVFGGIPWFFVDSWLKRDQWRVRIDTSREALTQEIDKLEKLLAAPKASSIGKAGEITSKRLHATLALKRVELQNLQNLLASLERDTTDPKNPLQLPEEKLPPLATKAFFDPMSYQQTLESYRTHTLRDWSWQSDENALFCGLIRAALLGVDQDRDQVRDRHGDLEKTKGTALVAGCGAGRLLWDLATDPGVPWGFLIGLDLNPYLLHVGTQILEGSPVELVEWPVSPLMGHEGGFRQRLALPQKRPPVVPFQLWVGDWLTPPFMPGSLATIITPWFIDILPEPPMKSIARILHLLEPGGTWIFAGSTTFQHGEFQDHWSRQEFLAAVQDAGFDIKDTTESTIPYLHSPHEAQKRWENILVFRALKPPAGAPQHPAAAPLDQKDPVWPPWLTDHHVPIPRIPLFKNQAHHHKILALTLDLIDGKRSVSDMAQVIAKPVGISHEAACRSVAAFLQALWETL